jgi:hypothetical protein
MNTFLFVEPTTGQALLDQIIAPQVINLNDVLLRVQWSKTIRTCGRSRPGCSKNKATVEFLSKPYSGEQNA